MERIREKNINTPDYWDSRSGPAYLRANYNRGKAKQDIVIENLPQGVKMLDVGCYGGNFRRYMLEQGRDDIEDFTGLDFSPKSVEAAKNTLPEDKWVLANCYDIPFEDNTFGVIAALEVLEHLERPKDFLSEAERVLVDEGLLLVTVPNARKGSKEHVWVFNKESLPRLIRESLQANIEAVVEVPPGRRYLFVMARVKR